MLTEDGPRELYEAHGPRGLGEIELLALVLGTGVKGQSTLQIASRLVQEFGGVQGIAAAPPGALTVVPGLGLARAVRLHAACALARSARTRRRDRLTVSDAGSAWRMLRPGLEGLPHEELHALYLDRRGRVLHLRCVSAGCDGFTIVEPRQILRPAIQIGASALIVGHNHPSGDPTPSPQDLQVTRRLALAGQVLGVPLLDHIVVGDGRFVSLAEQGELPLPP